MSARFYEVTLDVDPALADAVERYMRDKHIPEIFATGCFQAIHLERAGETHFRTRYHAATEADLDRYLRDHTAHFRADFVAHFPSGVTVHREVWAPVSVVPPTSRRRAAS